MIWLSMTQISRFTGGIVPIAQVVTGDGDESAALEGGGGFADCAPRFPPLSADLPQHVLPNDD
jgi:hypothetical protein